MNSLFSYDSKLMQILMRVGDLMILNICFVLCCLPIVTIGAAQAGLYSAAKVMMDKEDDSSPTKAYFKGFINGIGHITLAWTIVTVLFAGLIYASMIALYRGSALWILLVAIGLFGFLTCLIPVIHSRFGCTFWQLIRNGFLMALAHPLRTIGILIVTWLPAILFLTYTTLFFRVAPIWITLYYSTAHLFAYQFMKKPMDELVADFVKKHSGETEQTNEEPEQLEEAEEEEPVLPQ